MHINKLTWALVKAWCKVTHIPLKSTWSHDTRTHKLCNAIIRNVAAFTQFLLKHYTSPTMQLDTAIEPQSYHNKL